MSKPLRVGIYLRVSTTDQTVENQRRELARVIEQRGWAVVGEYVDHGVSGAKGRDKRPAFDRICKDASQGKLDIIASWSIDRIGRSLSHVATFMAELSAQNVALYLHQQNVDGTTPAGRAMLGMAAVFAEFERSIIIERIRAGVARAKAQGKHCGRPRSVPLETQEAVTTLRAQGWGKLRIARHLRIGVSTTCRIIARGVAQ